jgi:hypothetical protein
MSFRFLPLPLFVLLFTFASIYLFYYAKQTWKKDPKLLSIAYILIGIGIILTVIARVAEKLYNFKNSLGVVIFFTTILLVSLILIFIGGYQKVWHDPQKKRIITIVAVFLLIDFILLGFLAFWIIHK